MQADLANPLWDALRATHRDGAQWAVLMTSDADGNRRTDFLDVLLPIATSAGLAAAPVEVLVYATDATRGALAAELRGTEIEAAGAVFASVPLSDVPGLVRDGVTLVVWEPRAHASASANPAGGSPGSMPQTTLHQANLAWADGYTGTGIRIAVLDTGANTGHHALDSGKVTAFKDCIGSGASSYDDQGHGTHVASIAAGHDGTDFKGIAPDADLVIVKVLDSAGSGSLAEFDCGVEWVRNVGGAKRADVATMSAGLGVPPLAVTTLNGGPFDVFGWDAVATKMTASNIPFTVAAGNWVGPLVEVHDVDETTRVGVNGVNQVSSPAIAPTITAVGAVSEYGAAGHFTALGPGYTPTSTKPDVAAMGVSTWGALHATTGSYEQWDGTSMATPVAAGVIALLMDADASIQDNSVYEGALRWGAGPACIWSDSPGSCILPMEKDPNFVVGHGIVQADASLAYI